MMSIADVTKIRKLPWIVQEPFEGCDDPTHNHARYSVWDNDGKLVCECYGEDEGRSEAIAICAAANLTGPAICDCCGNDATCFGAYETGLEPKYACDDCCGHGCEDGYCDLLYPPPQDDALTCGGIERENIAK